MNKIVFLLAASLMMVNSSRLFKRQTDVMSEPLEDIEATASGKKASCGSCTNMVFQIKCGPEYSSHNCGDCSLICDCKDESTYPPPAGSPQPNPASVSAPSIQASGNGTGLATDGLGYGTGSSSITAGGINAQATGTGLGSS